MQAVHLPDDHLAATITRAASKQTYYTIRFLVDHERVPDAYRAYAYFRWLDDCLDRPDVERAERLALVERQKDLMARLYCGETPDGLSREEQMLADLIRSDHEKNSGLQIYIRNMMAVMDFDASRRGRLITRRELTEYARCLSAAVTEALHYFIGHDDYSPHGSERILAVTGAHITHMLRDGLDDIPAGYVNIPRELLALHPEALSSVDSPTRRRWVRSRVEMARACFKAGKRYLSRVANLRCRLAGYAYMARFESVLDAIEADGYRLRSAYPECKRPLAALNMVARALWQALVLPGQRSLAWALDRG